MQRLDIGHAHELKHLQVLDGAGACRGIGHFIRIGLGVRNKFLDRLGWKPGMGYQKRGI